MTTIPDLTNTSSWSDEDLIALYRACLTEQERRRRLVDLPAQATGFPVPLGDGKVAFLVR